jgi:hypothetical protein
MRILTTIALLLCSIVTWGQSKHLPAKVTIAMTDKQVIELSNQIDSLYMVIQASDIPSKIANHRINKVQLALSPIWMQCTKQMVVDSVKKGAGK